MSMCDDARTQGIAKVLAAYGPLLTDLLKVIVNMKAKDLDSTKYYDAAKDQIINLPALVVDLTAKQEAGVATVNKKVDEECEQSLAFIQSVVDAAVSSFTLGLSEVLPKHMTHVDVGEILAGKPLGGDNSIFNQVRDSVFNTIGMGETNDLRRVVEDPITTTKDGVNDALEKAGLPFRL